MADQPSVITELDFGDEAEEEASAGDELRLQLETRCKSAGIEVVKGFGPDIPPYQKVRMPNGKDKREIPVHSISALRQWLALPFEKFVILGDYDAIASYNDGSIEAAVRPLGQVPTSYLLRRLLGASQDGTSGIGEITAENAAGVRLRLGPSSPALGLLGGRGGPSFSLALSNLKLTRHDQALSILENVANSFFFELDLTRRISLGLVRDRSRAQRFSGRPLATPPPIQFPVRQFDSAPTSLFWYARSATGMPLLQYLAYYQVLEFYFPMFATKEAAGRVARILKDPSFRADRDTDITKIIAVTRTSRSGSFGSERDQLRATVNGCLESDDIRTFLSENEQLSSVLSEKQKGLTSHKLNLLNSVADLRIDVADLIYDIRCKIVHTKADDGQEDAQLLLPFSREAELLRANIELVKFIAERVLIASNCSPPSA